MAALVYLPCTPCSAHLSPLPLFIIAVPQLAIFSCDSSINGSTAAIENW